MPFKSDKQRRYLYANEPEVAKEFARNEAIKRRLRRTNGSSHKKNS